MGEKIVLALGGGGVKGIAHLGVVACLLDRGYEIQGIAGTSAGGMFGAPLAAGVDPRKILEAVFDFMKKPDLSRDPSDGASFAGTHGLENALSPFVQDMLIEDFPIKFAATAVSLRTGQEVIIDSGDAMQAILATIAIPGVFPTQGEDELVDGGVLDPVPILPARELNPSLAIVAVALHDKPPGTSTATASLTMNDPIADRVVSRLYRTRIGKAVDIMNRGLTMGMDKLSELSIEAGKPDVVVRPLVGQYSSLMIVDSQEMFDEGYRAMEEQLPALDEACSLLNSFKRIGKYARAKPPEK